jgi:hypothetical protein
LALEICSSSLQNWPEWFSDVQTRWLCWPGNMLKFTFMLFKPWLNCSRRLDHGTNRIEYSITIFLSKLPQKVPRVSLLESGILDCRLPWVFSERKLFLMVYGTTWRTPHLTTSSAHFQLSDVQVLW